MSNNKVLRALWGMQRLYLPFMTYFIGARNFLTKLPLSLTCWTILKTNEQSQNNALLVVWNIQRLLLTFMTTFVGKKKFSDTRLIVPKLFMNIFQHFMNIGKIIVSVLFEVHKRFFWKILKDLTTWWQW